MKNIPSWIFFVEADWFHLVLKTILKQFGQMTIPRKRRKFFFQILIMISSILIQLKILMEVTYLFHISHGRASHAKTYLLLAVLLAYMEKEAVFFGSGFALSKK